MTLPDRSQIQRWAALAAYLVYSASGLLLVSLCPRTLLPHFLMLYPAINSVASFAIMLFYTNARSRAMDMALLATTTIAVVAFVASGNFALLLGSFVLVTVVLDYSAAQSFSVARQSQLRLILALCTIVLPFNFLAFLLIRTTLALMLLALSIRSKDYDLAGHPPSLGKAGLLLALNLVYFTPLYAVGAYLSDKKRLGYLLYAVVSNILVRIMDFEAKLVVSGQQQGHSLVFHAVLTGGLTAVAIFAALVTPAYLLMGIPLVVIALIRSRYIRLTWS